MGMVQGNNGIYRITLPDGKWAKVSDLGGTYTGLYSGLAGGAALVPHCGWTAGNDGFCGRGADLFLALETLRSENSSKAARSLIRDTRSLFNKAQVLLF
jgi:hypothetical protein